MSACLSGCVSFGTHRPSCTGFSDSGMDCRGCTPREASEGLLCARCWGNLQRDVRTAPSIIDWIREHVEPSSQWGERINSGEVDAPAPLSVTAVDDADELHACLASWALLILEEHPARLVGPNVPRQWRATDGTVVGLMPDSNATTAVSRFVATHAEWAANQPWAGEMVAEVGALVRTLLARYPEAERSRHLTDARCPVCERTTMVYHPPAWAGSDVLVQCDYHGCGCIVPEDRYGLFMAMVIADRKRELEESA